MNDEIKTINITNTVKIRKYSVNETELKQLLKTHKKYTNKEIAEKLNQPITKVEHWFRNDSSFSIPDADIWLKLKELLEIKTNKFDSQIMEFIEKTNSYDKSNRLYDIQGIAPTITATDKGVNILIDEIKILGHLEHYSAMDLGNRVYSIDGIAPACTAHASDTLAKILIKENNSKGYSECKIPSVVNLSYAESTTRRGRVQDNGDTSPTVTTKEELRVIEEHYRIRKLTPKECWRLMGFSDEDFEKAAKVNSNSQLYKQAGNSIVVPVLEGLFSSLLN